MTARIKGLSREQNERAWLAWHIAALGRVEKMPKLAEMMTIKRSARRVPTWQEQAAAMTAWAQSRSKT